MWILDPVWVDVCTSCLHAEKSRKKHQDEIPNEYHSKKHGIICFSSLYMYNMVYHTYTLIWQLGITPK